jgi:hypothetical protein
MFSKTHPIDFHPKLSGKFKKKEMKMKIAKRLWVGAGTVIVVAAVLILAVPKTVQAVVATLIRDVDNPGRATVVNASCDVLTQSGMTANIACFPAYTVPAGNRLVIQHVEGSCRTPQGDSLAFTNFTVTTNGNPVVHYFPLVNEGTDHFISPVATVFATNQAVTYYADPGSTLGFGTFISDAAGNTFCFFQLSGHLISYP